MYEAKILYGKKMVQVKSRDGEPHIIYQDKRRISEIIINVIKKENLLPKMPFIFGVHCIFSRREESNRRH